MKKPLRDIATVFGLSVNSDRIITSFICDSRKSQDEALFFALSGDRVNGHLYLKDVADGGGVAAVVSKEYLGADYGLVLLYVDCVLDSLHQLSRRLFQEYSPLVIGVTGSIGKTTTKEFIAHLLKEQFSVAKTYGNMNSQVGLPLTVLNWSGKDQVCVFEIGMSKPGELIKLVDIIQPHLGVLTNIHAVHAESFDAVEDIATEKAALFSSKRMQKGFFPSSSSRFKVIAKLSVSKEWFDQKDLQGNHQHIDIVLPDHLKHFQSNCFAAISIASHIGISFDSIIKSVATLKTCGHRFERVVKKEIVFIDDAYNAAPFSMCAAMDSLPISSMRIGCLGSMKELGMSSCDSHREILLKAQECFDYILLIGEEWLESSCIIQQIGQGVKYFESKKDMTLFLKTIVRKDAVVLLKGSHSFMLWTLLEEF